jgi:hypothetical protein
VPTVAVKLAFEFCFGLSWTLRKGDGELTDVFVKASGGGVVEVEVCRSQGSERGQRGERECVLHLAELVREILLRL